MLTKDTPLGNLTILVVFEFHDFPILFSCKNDTEQIFIANWVATDEVSDSWLFCPISNKTHAQITNGKIDYYSIFKGSETGHLMLMTLGKDQALRNFEWLKADAISDEMLPIPGNFAEIPTAPEGRDKLSPAGTEVMQRAEEMQHTVGHLHFGQREVRKHAAATSLVGRGLVEFQAILDAVGQASTGAKSHRGVVPKKIRGETQTFVTAFQPGSLGVEIVAEDPVMLFDNSLTVDSFYKTAQIIAESENYVRLQAIMPEMGPRVAIRYKRFLSILKEYQSDIEFEFSSASGIVSGASKITYEQALVAFENISKIEEEAAEKVSIIGILIGLDKTTSHFTLRDSDLKLYGGKFNESDGNFASGAVIDAEYSAQLLKILEIDTVSGKEVSRWLLTGLALVSPPAQ